jgi:SulP family sulfate permease
MPTLPRTIQELKFGPQVLKHELLAGLIMAIVTIPSGLAGGVLARVNPVHGVYSMVIGTPVAAVFTASAVMNVDNTSAAALGAGNAVGALPAERQVQALVVLAILVGLFQLIFGLLKLGFITRFVSNSVMTGFLTGIGVLTILGQINDLTGYSSPISNKVFRLLDTVANFRQIDLATLGVGLLTIAVIILVDRTPQRRFSLIAGMGAATVVALLLPAGVIPQVGDTTAVPATLPSLHLPNLALVPDLLVPALSLAIITLVQAAGVSQSYPNPDGRYPDPSGDFRGQGLANIATGFFGGLPVGGSVSGTAVLQSTGAKTRWAGVFAGAFGAIILLFFGQFIEILPMTGLAALLVYTGFTIIKPDRVLTVWHTGPIPRVMMSITFLATLFLPIQSAVFVGVALNVLVYLFRSAEAVRIAQLAIQPDRSIIQSEAPKTLASHAVTVLQPIGNLFFAGAAEFESNLPDDTGTRQAVVILRLRDRDEVGSTFVRILDRYARSLQARGGKLMLVGVGNQVYAQLERTGVLDDIGRENVFLAQPKLGDSLLAAYTAASAWLVAHRGSNNASGL